MSFVPGLVFAGRLSDAGRMIQKDLDIAEYTDAAHNPMIPHTIVLEPGLVVFKIYNGYWFFGRPTLEELRQDLRAVTKKCRPDWDITDAEHKAAWQRGEQMASIPTVKATPGYSGSRTNERGSSVFRKMTKEIKFCRYFIFLCIAMLLQRI
jgi:hypothetical protein